ncbi:LAFE_0F07998g1_1 [Lachancea fermentati]|uniref:DNA mismatch repair protein HSM3 n=1 Tax=Lachancea fermentati TaxID=4955 RepID=A0A1G4MF65_LACFM|nr:LAFE_0F07998g1_1 [Lachancea fermentati]
MAADQVHSQLQDLLEKLVTCIRNRDYVSLNKLMAKASLDFSVSTSINCDPKSFLTEMRSLLYLTDDETLDYDLTVEMLDRVISISPFEEVLEVFTVDNLRAALLCQIRPLQISACKVLERSYPKGLFACSDLFDILLKLLFEPMTDVVLVNEIEVVFERLKTDALVRRRVLEDNLLTLENVKECSDPVLLARLYKILGVFFECITRTEFKPELFITSKEDIMRFIDVDILLFINVTSYYCDLLECIKMKPTNPSPLVWALSYIVPALEVYGYIYKNLNQMIDVKHFGRAYIFRLLRAISNLDDLSFFESFDKNYINLSSTNPDISNFLAFINPRYLLEFHKELLADLFSVKPSSLNIARNILTNESCFHFLKDKFTSAAILDMPYLEQMVLLEKMTLYKYSAIFLLHNLPQVMTNLIEADGRNVTERETANLRREAIENLLHLNAEALNVWKIPLEEAYGRIIGRSTRVTGAEIASTFI